MISLNLESGAFITVEWLDAKTYAGWHRADAKLTLAKMTSVGVVIRSDAEALVLSHSANLKDGWFWEAVVIPWSGIVRVKEMKG